jgi:hypothetical protein
MNPSRGAGFEPDHSLEQEILMQRLVKYPLGDRVSAETWKRKQLAVLISKGCVLGKASKSKSTVDSGSNVQEIEAIIGNTST